MKSAWIDGKYNISRLVLLPGVEVVAEWATAGGFKVSFCGSVVLKARFQSMDEAKAAGERLAHQQLTKALEALR